MKNKIEEEDTRTLFTYCLFDDTVIACLSVTPILFRCLSEHLRRIMMTPV